MPSFAASTLITRARTITTTGGTSGSAFISDAEALRHLTVAYAWVHALLVKADPDYFESSTSLTTDGTESRPLPADFYGAKRVDYRYDSTRYAQLDRITISDINEYQNFGGASPNASAYRIVGANCVFYPTPPTGQVYRLIYIPAPTAFTATSDTVDIRAGWDQIVVLRLALLIRIQEESDTTDLLRELESEVQRLVASADDMNAIEGVVVRDVESFDDDFLPTRQRRIYR